MAKSARRERAPRAKPAQFRHELKYLLSRGDYEILSRTLAAVLPRDRYAVENGGEYQIRSLYFDDRYDSALNEKLDGVDNRDKFRLRIYNGRDDVIKLERKHKEAGFISKTSVKLCREECDRLLRGDRGFLLDRPEPFAKYMFAQFASRGLRPVVIVDYVREPYIYPLEDVRITFDKDIRTAYRGVDLFDFRQPTYPAMDGCGIVLEVKFNRCLPAYVREMIQPGACIRSAVSKYCLCRKFEF